MKSFLVIIGFILLALLGMVLVITGVGQHESEESLHEFEKPFSIKEDPYGSADNYYRFKKAKRKRGIAKNDAPEEYAKLERAKRTPGDRKAPEYAGNYKIEELTKARSSKFRNQKSDELNFIERGPSNVAGRTRALLVLPSDETSATWLAGSASGGIWKTTDRGTSWSDKTGDFPSLGTNTLAMSRSDANIIYAGTGEHFTNDIDGVGMFKSLDEGETWTQIVKPGDYDAFRNVSRIVVHPEDPNIVIATTRNSIFEDSLRAAIYKSIDGGQTWDMKRFSLVDRFDDIAVNFQNFNTIYVAISRNGVIKSKDEGETWTDMSLGLQLSGRLEIATSPVDTNYVWGSAQGSASSTGSDLYISRDGATTWQLAVEEGEAIDFLGGQGWYDNVIEAHPFSKDVAYVGGVNLFKMNVSDTETADVIYSINDNGAFTFLDFVNDIRIGGGIIEGDLQAEEAVSIEIRFGAGSQKAHRFTVNGRGSGVPATDYIYQDLVDVPFQVWDNTNDQQLMVSFRDQQEDGEWTLKEQILNNGDTPNDSREYIFIQVVPYSPEIDTNIARNGGHDYRQQFLMWPVLKEGQTFDPAGQEPLGFSIDAKQTFRLTVNSEVISDAYNDFNGNNSFTGEEFSNNKGHHPDQHSLHFVVSDTTRKIFSLITTNDGGVYLSNLARDPGISDGSFTYAGFKYNTSQFYGADKMPGQDRYIGGMQDNSTWFTSRGDVGSATTSYEFAFGGDGFESIWNNRDPNLIIGSVQFNSLRRSTDEGRNWQSADGDITDIGPFISRVANSRALPDRLFTVGSSGVWVSNDFGAHWTSIPINSMWSFNNSVDIEVSSANPDVIWAGGRLDEGQRLFVSNDGGQSFKPTSFYQETEMGFVSGIGVHPTDDKIGYALFSFARRPKVLKTEDQGQSWVDITGYEGNNGISSNGFPDVATNCLLVFPNDTDRIWVGTEIGIVESLDNGNSWHLLNENLPAVNVFDMKIQDDQIVLATYGRGIWSVQVEGIEREYIFPPIITSVGIHPNGSINIGAELSSQFDSVHFIIDDIAIGRTIMVPDIGELILPLEGTSLADGNYNFNLIGFDNGVEYISLTFNADLFEPGIPTEEYFNDFSADSLNDHFIGSGFSVRLEPGFDDPAIHSDHNYNDNGEIMYQLKTPIIVSEDQTFRYRDIALVELGEDLVSFGSSDFYDYVVAEGSDDGIKWRPLFDGYDSSLNPDWKVALNADQSGNSNLFMTQEVDLTDEFDVGDIIFIRYRLFADPFVNGWGWAIDDVEVSKENTTPVFDPVFQSVKFYPNPADDVLFINFPSNIGISEIIISDIQGRVVYRASSRSQDVKLELSTSTFSDGLYFVEIYNKGRLSVSEKIVILH